MNDRLWKCQEKRRSNEHGAEEPKEKQAPREPSDENLDIKIWTETRKGQTNCQ